MSFHFPLRSGDFRGTFVGFRPSSCWTICQKKRTSEPHIQKSGTNTIRMWHAIRNNLWNPTKHIIRFTSTFPMLTCAFGNQQCRHNLLGCNSVLNTCPVIIYITVSSWCIPALMFFKLSLLDIILKLTPDNIHSPPISFEPSPWGMAIVHLIGWNDERRVA